MYNKLIKSIIYRSIIKNANQYGIFLSTFICCVSFWFSPKYFLLGAIGHYYI